MACFRDRCDRDDGARRQTAVIGRQGFTQLALHAYELSNVDRPPPADLLLAEERGAVEPARAVVCMADGELGEAESGKLEVALLDEIGCWVDEDHYCPAGFSGVAQRL